MTRSCLGAAGTAMLTTTPPTPKSLSMLLLPLLLSLALVACGSTAPRPEKGIAAAAGRDLFVNEFSCNTCHPGGNKGVGPALHGPQFRKDRPTDASIAEQIRHGGGQMPAFPEQRMSDVQLREIIAYIHWLDEHEQATR